MFQERSRFIALTMAIVYYSTQIDEMPMNGESADRVGKLYNRLRCLSRRSPVLEALLLSWLMKHANLRLFREVLQIRIDGRVCAFYEDLASRTGLEEGNIFLRVLSLGQSSYSFANARVGSDCTWTPDVRDCHHPRLSK